MAKSNADARRQSGDPRMTAESRERARRVRGLQADLTRASLDAMMVHDPFNVFYLTGLKASLAYLLVTPREAVLLVDGRYIEAARAAVPHCDVRLMCNLGKDLLKLARETGARRFGFEGSTPWKEQRRWTELLGGEWTESSVLLVKQRIRKSAGEVKLLEKSARLNDAVFERALEAVRPGATELDVRNAIRGAADAMGAEGLSFDCIVAGGPMGSRPHYEPQARPLARGELLLIDLGVRLGGYCSDMTRMVALGRKPKARLMRAFDAVLEAEQAAVAAAKPGVACRELDEIAREVLRGRRFEKSFTHGLGHGVGLEIHEPPTLNSRTADVLRAGMVVTIEPGVYLPGLGGIRIEDMIVITRNGNRVLSRAPRDFRLVPFD